MTERQFNGWRWGVFALTVAVLSVLFVPGVNFTIVQFREPHEDLSHGWAIPFVSGYAIWRLRAQLRAAAAGPDWRGAPALALCCLLFWLGNRGEQARLMQIGMFACVTVLPLVFWGRRVARLLLFPAAYLCFLLPTSFLDELTFHLRLLATGISCGMLNGVGIAVQQVGTAMISADGSGFKLDVANPCSGMRSIFAMAALTAAYAYFTHRRTLHRWLLFVSAVPLAVIGNIVRIIAIGLVAHFLGQQRALGFFHDYSGYVVFVVAVLLMTQVDVWLGRLFPGVAPAEPPSSAVESGAAARPMGRALAPCLAAFVLAAICLAAVVATPPPVMEPDTFVAAAMPDRVGAFRGVAPWFCQNDQCLASFGEDDLRESGHLSPPVCPRCGQPLLQASLGEKSWLPADTRIVKRTYTRLDGSLLAVTTVMAGMSRGGIHRPEMCLPGQGFEIRTKEVRTMDLGQGRTLRVNVVRAVRAGDPPVGFIYWFVNRRGEATSHWRRIFGGVWARCVHNRIDRWCMITVFSNRSFDDPDAWHTTEQFLAEWYPQVRRTDVAPPATRPGG